MLKLFLEIGIDLPKVSYLKAIDYYLIICFGFVILSIIEFAIVNEIRSDFESISLNESNFRCKSRRSSKKIHDIPLNVNDLYFFSK